MEKDVKTTATDMVEYMREALVRGVQLSPAEWKQFQNKVEERFPDFRETMHAEMLRCEEFRICLLLKVGFCPTETEHILGLKPKTLSTYQKRLLKKIFSTDGSAKEFRERLKGRGREAKNV